MMEKNKTNNKFGRLTVVLVLVLLLTISAVQAFVQNDRISGDSIPVKQPNTSLPLLEDSYYTWEDLFTDVTKVDPTMSYNYEIVGGFAKMKDTYPLWTDPAWTRMKQITVTNNAGQALQNYALHLTVSYDSDMNPNYGDIRFKHENSGNVFCDYWIESYDATAANIWVRIPYTPAGNSKMYLFYGNPSATSQSNYYNVFTVWDEKWPNDEQITYHANHEGAWDPDVCFGNDHFLVLWEEGQPYYPPYTFGFKQEIRGSMYDLNGNRVVFDKLVYQDSTLYYRNENPSAAYGGGKFFVAWERYDTVANPSITTMDIKARTVTRSGSGFQLGSVINVCSQADCQADPHVTYDSVNNRFCVVWEDARSGQSNYNVYGRLYDTNGNTIGGEKSISVAANSQCEPWVAFNPIHAQYMIVWEEGVTANNGPFSVKGGIFDANLNQVGSTFTVAAGSDIIDYTFPRVEFSPETERFLVTWNDCDISSGDWHGNVWGKVYDVSGNVLVPTFPIKTGDFIQTCIVPYLSSSFFVSFNSKSPGGNSGKIWGKLVSSSGEVFTGDVQLSASTAAEADWAHMAVGNGKIFVAWEDIRVVYPYPWNNNPDVYGNIWHLNIPSGTEMTATVGEEKTLLLEAQVMSIQIAPDNLLSWVDFTAVFDEAISFDVMNGAGNVVLIPGISSGQSLQTLDPAAIRLRATFTRPAPSSSPSLDSWRVRYIGVDEVAPVTLLQNITGNQGLGGWYISQGVTVWLSSYDLPHGTASGVNHTYYTLNAGSTNEYSTLSGISLVATQQSNWMGVWDVTFWSVDNAGNIEDHTKPENTIQIKIDAERPYVEITEPAEEQQVNLPFWVRANASDNALVSRVEFDIEPFGQHPGLPFVDTEPPYEWFCNVSYIHPMNPLPSDGPHSLGVNKMVRARVVDQSGQSWMHEIWVHILNMESYGKRFMIGFLKNREISDYDISFTTRCIFSLTLDTFDPVLYLSNERFVVSRSNKIGYIGPLGIIGFFDTILVE